jgi:uncharacterized 2Fe-2S/4Fe-4S cluster protein (DUF4445 family)
MQKLTVTVKPWNISFSVPKGSSLFRALSSHGFFLDAPCGGRGTCGRCAVRVYSEENAGRWDTLQSCRATVEKNMTVEILPESQAAGYDKNFVFSETVQNTDPGVRFYPLEISLSGASALEEILRHLPEGTVLPGGGAGLGVLQKAALSADRQKQVTAVVADGFLTDIRPRSAASGPLGVAVDLGTTTVAAALVDLREGVILSSASVPNRQRTCGADVISRADYAVQSADNLRFLQESAAGTINEVILELREGAGIDGEYIDEIVVAGNPVMMHLLAGVSPALLVKAPYTPVFRGPLRLDAGELGLGDNPAASVYITPGISAYVGGDTVAALYSTGMHRREKPCLLIDIGTNGEIVLGCRDGLVACSAAAGPAFEGAGIRHGMNGARGAVSRFDINDNGEIIYNVIGGVKPVGICGSGLIDAVAVMLEGNIIGASGSFNKTAAQPSALRRRLTNGDRGREFVVIEARDTAHGRAVTINRKDLEEIQLAKGAIRAGIEILLEYAGVNKKKIEEVFLAGTFGSCLRPENAAAVGLWPEFPKAKISPVGNAAGIGALMFLLSKAARREAEELSLRIEHLNLASVPDFMERFSRSLSF